MGSTPRRSAARLAATIHPAPPPLSLAPQPLHWNHRAKIRAPRNSMSRQPVIVISHGAPTFALNPGQLGPRLTAVGRQIARPKAVLIVSPHWMTRGVRVATGAAPETVHDFGGFGQAQTSSKDHASPGSSGAGSPACKIEVLRAARWPALRTAGPKARAWTTVPGCRCGFTLSAGRRCPCSGSPPAREPDPSAGLRVRPGSAAPARRGRRWWSAIRLAPRN